MTNRTANANPSTDTRTASAFSCCGTACSPCANSSKKNLLTVMDIACAMSIFVMLGIILVSSLLVCLLALVLVLSLVLITLIIRSSKPYAERLEAIS